MLSGKKILLGITGGIAAYKSAYLVRLLKKAGADPAYQAPILGKSVLSYYQEGCLALLLKETFGNP